MAIIVDKVQKRKDIALTCKTLFVKQGIKNLTISQIAKEAGVGKGTLYDYFKNKEDIVFEILNTLIVEHDARKEQRIAQVDTTKEKIKLFFEFFYNDEVELRELYKEFISITLSEPNLEMSAYQAECYETYAAWLKRILQEGVEKGEIVEKSLALSNGLFAFGKGIFITSCVTNKTHNLQQEIDEYIDTLFDLIEVKK